MVPQDLLRNYLHRVAHLLGHKMFLHGVLRSSSLLPTSPGRPDVACPGARVPNPRTVNNSWLNGG